MDSKQQSFTDRFERVRLAKEQKIEVLARKNWHAVLGIDQKELSLLAEYLTPYQGAEGTVIFRKGDQESFMCLVNSGTVAIYPTDRREGAQAISELDEGNIVGEMALIDGAPRSAFAYAGADTELFVMTRGNFVRLEEEHPAVWGKLILFIARLLSSRLRRTNDSIGQHAHLKWKRID